MNEIRSELNEAEDKKCVIRPVVLVSGGLLLLIACMIWFGIKNPVIFEDIRDLVITLTALLLFIIGTAIAVICFLLNSRIETAKVQLGQLLVTADGKVDEIADRTADILKKILAPFVEAKAKHAGLRQVLSRKKAEE